MITPTVPESKSLNIASLLTTVRRVQALLQSTVIATLPTASRDAVNADVVRAYSREAERLTGDLRVELERLAGCEVRS